MNEGKQCHPATHCGSALYYDVGGVAVSTATYICPCRASSGGYLVNSAHFQHRFQYCRVYYRVKTSQHAQHLVGACLHLDPPCAADSAF